jgi:pimeloyl-ACP methyl ester carboxylesterase
MMMRWKLRWPAAVLVCSCIAASRGASAQKPGAEPERLETPAGSVEVGILNGAPYRIDIPNEWNHSLVVYYHGYSMQGVTFHVAEKAALRQQPFLQRHYAVIQSGYSQPGWALQQAYPETEALRRYFVKSYGPPHETFVAGESMGGALVAATLELNPRPYAGGLDLCGAVGPTFESFEHRFALRAAFDFYFPGVMPTLVPTPQDYDVTAAVREKIQDALRKNPEAAASMRALMGLHTDAAVADDIAYFTFVVADMQRRARGNPFDNRNYLYAGSNPASSAGDYALNDGVRRYAADEPSRQYLYSHYTPTGRLTKPMLALHTLYDLRVPPGSLALYGHIVTLAGFSRNLVQQYVKREGHCNITGDEEGMAFDELTDWTLHGIRPLPGALK